MQAPYGVHRLSKTLMAGTSTRPVECYAQARQDPVAVECYARPYAVHTTALMPCIKTAPYAYYAGPVAYYA